MCSYICIWILCEIPFFISWFYMFFSILWTFCFLFSPLCVWLCLWLQRIITCGIHPSVHPSLSISLTIAMPISLLEFNILHSSINLLTHKGISLVSYSHDETTLRSFEALATKFGLLTMDSFKYTQITPAFTQLPSYGKVYILHCLTILYNWYPLRHIFALCFTIYYMTI